LPIGNESPVVHTTAKPVISGMLPDVKVITGAECASIPAPSEPEVMEAAINPYRQGDVPRRTFTDVTAHPKFAHDASYHWLVGRLDYSKIQNAWTLRFASVEDEDRCGGSVTLEDDRRLREFKSGQLVRVEGNLLNPEDPQAHPAYQVRDIQLLEP
jgi:hypothetical protein